MYSIAGLTQSAEENTVRGSIPKRMHERTADRCTMAGLSGG